MSSNPDLDARLLISVRDQMAVADELHAGGWIESCQMPREVAMLMLSRIHRGPLLWSSAAMLQKCESPIEELFLLWLVLAAEEFPAPILSMDGSVVDHYDWGWKIATQVELSGYRADFSLEYVDHWRRARTILIECDGHEFHERTKAQASRDKSRDRKLALAGYHVIRYTGSEIWNDGWRCATEACEIAAQRPESAEAGA